MTETLRPAAVHEDMACVKPPEAAPAQTYAALDLGTNNCRLLIARPEYGSFRVVDSFSRIIRLGEGVSTTGRISEAAIVRAMAALAVCRDKIRFRHATRLRLIATEACRAAENAEDFCADVERELGLRLEIIDRETEARFAMIGCTPLMESDADGVILFDIGGGSTELVRVMRDADGAPQRRGWVSLPFGVVTLAERFGGVDVTPASYAAMVDEVAAHLATFAGPDDGNARRMHLLGTSGTVTTLGALHLGLARYDRRRVDGLWMMQADIDAAIAALMRLDCPARTANQCIGPDRADLVLPGCAILDAIRQAFPLPRLRVADRGLREGMLVEMMRDDGALEAA